MYDFTNTCSDFCSIRVLLSGNVSLCIFKPHNGIDHSCDNKGLQILENCESQIKVNLELFISLHVCKLQEELVLAGMS